MDVLKKEIREALLGDLVPSADRRLEVSFSRLTKYRNGLGDGYDKVLFFGVMCRRRWYLSRKGARQMHDLAVKGMQDMGRMLRLSSEPDKEAVYCTYLLNTPAILTYSRGKDGVIEVACYSARGLSGWLACFRTLNLFQKKVPDVLQRMSEEDEQKRQGDIRVQTAEERLADKQAKQEKKQEKRRLRKEKRRARLQKMTGVLPRLSELPIMTGSGSGGQRLTEHWADGDWEEAEDLQSEQPDQEQYSDGQLTESDEGQAPGQQPAGQAMELQPRSQATGQQPDEELLRLEAEAEQAKLAAQAARARLEAAQAKLEAQEAQAKLAELEARLEAAQGSSGGTQMADREHADPAVPEAHHELQESGSEATERLKSSSESYISKNGGYDHSVSNHNASNPNRKKRKNKR